MTSDNGERYHMPSEERTRAFTSAKKNNRALDAIVKWLSL
jgi:hypothetical protein